MTDKKNIEISPSIKIEPKEIFGVSCGFEVYKFKEKTEYVPEYFCVISKVFSKSTFKYNYMSIANTSKTFEHCKSKASVVTAIESLNLGNCACSPISRLFFMLFVPFIFHTNMI